MDWPFNDPDFDDYDLDNVFEYEVRGSVALLRICGSKVSSLCEQPCLEPSLTTTQEVTEWKLATDVKWREWLSDVCWIFQVIVPFTLEPLLIYVTGRFLTS